MIGRVSGRILHRGSDHVLIDVHGIGYVVHVSDRTLAALGAPGAAATLFTEMVVREDLMQLIGFLTLAEKEWHRLLTSVQGVGAKAAMAILGTLGPDGTSRAIALGDWGAVKAAPGIGPKIAQRVVNELRDRAPSVMALGVAASPGEGPDELLEAAPAPHADTPAPAVPQANASAQAEALSALRNLGYAPADAAAAVASAGAEAETTEDLIRAALRLLAPKG